MNYSAVRARMLSVLLTAVTLLAGGQMGLAPSARAESETLKTDYPSSTSPDQVCLTWSDDPRTTQTIQWRTSPAVKKGEVQFREKAAPSDKCREEKAVKWVLDTPNVANDPVNHRFTAMLDDLKPGTTYTYRVGGRKGWSDWSEFTTVPQESAPFSFIYVGDPQVGLDTWGKMLDNAFECHPGAAFCVVAGDNVNRGNNRNEWDNLFKSAGGVFNRRPYVPAVGNHDCKGVGPRLLTGLTALPENGPSKTAIERSYCFNYGNALFLVLDSNLSIKSQTAWMEEQLKSSKATWKFAVYHHPAYSSSPKRDNAEVRELWGSLFDRYHLDMALQGHDHGYLRTKPMRAGKAVSSPAEGTVYVVAVSGTKLYDVGVFDYTEKAFSRTSTYQVIDIETGAENKLTYRAHDANGTVVDELVIVK